MDTQQDRQEEDRQTENREEAGIEEGRMEPRTGHETDDTQRAGRQAERQTQTDRPVDM